MEAFTTHTGRAVPLRRSNVDTDQIIPAHWLKKVTRDGFEDGLFEAWRKDPEFVLNQPSGTRAPPCWSPAPTSAPAPRVSTPCGRCRTTASRPSISSRFADIFRGNSLKNGLLTVVLPQETVDRLRQLAEADPTAEVTVDLVGPRGPRRGRRRADFELDDNARWRLLEGLDDISLTLREEPDIVEYEAAGRPSSRSTVEV